MKKGIDPIAKDRIFSDLRRMSLEQQKQAAALVHSLVISEQAARERGLSTEDAEPGLESEDDD